MSHRFSLADLPETVAAFPLPGALLLPRARLPLNIFEPRYLAMVDDALKTDHRLIAMIQPLEGKGATPPKLRRIGCAGRITSLSETEDGRYLIAISGVCRFRVAEELEGFQPYRRLRVEWGDFARDLTAQDTDPNFDRKAFLALLKRYFEASGLSSDWSSLEEAEEEMLINSLSMLCPFEVEEKQALLEAPRLAERRETICALMEFAIASRGEDTGSLQ